MFMDVCVPVCGDVPLVGSCIHSLGVCVSVCVYVRSTVPLLSVRELCWSQVPSCS